MKIIDTQSLETQHGSGAYPKRPLTLVRGEGMFLWDAAGRQYLDLASGFGVALLGHSHPKLVGAIQQQAGRLISNPGIYYDEQRAGFFAALAAHTPGDLQRFFLCNSGAEAVEAALKLARLLTGRPGVIAAHGAFHGRTLGALSATWKAQYRQPFAPLVPGFTHIPYNDLAAAEQAISGETAAVILEVVQGEGGVIPAQPGYLEGIRRFCDQSGVLLIFDEIQTGMGRTGSWFACQAEDVVPDILCLGKGIAGGVPMGVIAWRRSLGQFASGSHGSTFGGNPLACAAGRAAIEVLAEQRLPENAARMGDLLLERLAGLGHPLIRAVRGRGLLIGIELRRRSAPVLQAMLERGVLALPAGPQVVRFLPPLVMGEEHLERALAVLQAALDEQLEVGSDG